MLSNRRILSRRDREHGFLLTETLATFTISAFVLLGLVSASSVLLRTIDRGVAHVQEVDDLGQTMKAIERDIASLVRARWNGTEPQGFVFQGGPNSLYFAHARRGEDGTRQVRVIALREIVAERGTRLMRGEAYLSSLATGFDELHYGRQRELGTGATRVRFFYVPPPEAKSTAGRLREWRTARALPAAVIIEAIARDSRKVRMSTRVPIQANADIGCLDQDQSRDGEPPPPGSMAALDAAISNNNGVKDKEGTRPFCGREVRQDEDKQPSTTPIP